MSETQIVEWISVKDKLPSMGLFVIGTDKFNVHEVVFIHDVCLCFSGMKSKVEWEVTHWMPFPDLPKQDE